MTKTKGFTKVPLCFIFIGLGQTDIGWSRLKQVGYRLIVAGKERVRLDGFMFCVEKNGDV